MAGLVGPAGQGGGEALDQAVEAAVDAGGVHEAVFEGHEAVEGGTKRPGGVDGVVALEVVAGQDGTDDLLYRSPVGGFLLGVVGGRYPLGGGVAAGVLEGPVAIGVGQLALTASPRARPTVARARVPASSVLARMAMSALQGVHAVDVFVQRRLAHPEAAGESTARVTFDRPTSSAICWPLRPHAGLVEAGSRHSGSPFRRSGLRQG